MKQQRPSVPLFLLIGFCMLTFGLSSETLRADETPAPPATSAAQATAGVSPTPTPVPPSVRWVGVRNRKHEERSSKQTYAQRGDEIWVDVINFKDWIKDHGKNLDKPGWQNLVLYLDGIPLEGLTPFYSHESPFPYYTKDSIPYTITTFWFSLVHDEKSKVGWSHVLNQPVFNRKVAVSVGFPKTGEEIPSELKPDEQGSKEEFDQQFYLTIIPPFRTAFGLMVILGALVAFFALARYTHIIRDANSPRRPDGQRPYSLARGQMAFWFFLVIASYFFLWVVTGDMNTLNSSVLALIGISAGTALGSAFVDAAKPVPGRLFRQSTRCRCDPTPP